MMTREQASWQAESGKGAGLIVVAVGWTLLEVSHMVLKWP